MAIPKKSLLASIASALLVAHPAWPDEDRFSIAQLEPVYPKQALARCIEGWVYVELEIMEDGGVGNVYVLASEPHGIFEASTTHSLKQWVFIPRVENGKAVPYKVYKKVVFKAEKCKPTKNKLSRQP